MSPAASCSRPSASRAPAADGARRIDAERLERRLQRGAPLGAERARGGAQRRIELRQLQQARGRPAARPAAARVGSRHRDDDGAARLVAAEREAEAGLDGRLVERLPELLEIARHVLERREVALAVVVGDEPPQRRRVRRDQIGRLQVGVVGALEIAEAEAQHLAATIEQLGALGRLAHQPRQPPERVGRLVPRSALVM